MTMCRHQYQSGYLSNLFHLPDFEKTVNESLSHLTILRDQYKFDTIAFTGSSGAGLAYIASYLLKIPLLMVRKLSDDNHSRLPFEGNLESRRYLIVDDMISSCDTVARIINVLYRNLPDTKCVGAYLYTGCYSEQINLGWKIPHSNEFKVHTRNSMRDPVGYERDYVRVYRGGIPDPFGMSTWSVC